jgi:hypothetical protein
MLQAITHATELIGKALVTGTSQKTCHAIFVIAFEEKALSLMNRAIPSIISFIYYQRK